MKTVEEIKKVNFEALTSVDTERLALDIKKNMSKNDIQTCVEYVLDEIVELSSYVEHKNKKYFSKAKLKNCQLFITFFKDEAKIIWNKSGASK